MCWSRCSAPIRYGRLIEAECEAVGFPWWKLREENVQLDAADPGKYRDSHHARAVGTRLSNMRSGALALPVNFTPRPHPDRGRSPWEGMSGAAVLAGGALIAVVADNYPREGRA